ncbi:MAG: c-type cytochrome biogenesis protein CcmI [Candidatus Sedimenticola endophacoides]
MTTFWIISAAFIVVALAMVAPSLLRGRRAMGIDRNQQNVVIAQERLVELETDLANGVIDSEQFEQTKLELERALLLDLSDEPGEPGQASPLPGRIALGLLAVLVPALTIGLYQNIGAPEMVGWDASSSAHQQARGSERMPTVGEMIGSLTKRLEQDPQDEEGWYLLARTHLISQNYPAAVTAFEKVYELVGEDPSIMLSLADAEAMTRQGDMSGRPTELVRKAVLLSPESVTARWLAAMAEEQAGEPARALEHFQALAPLLDDEPESLIRVQGKIADLRDALGENAGAALPPIAAPAAGIKVRVTLAEALAAEAEPGQSVFIYAKALEGPAMPLAAQRVKVEELPVEVVLDDSSAMLPQMRLSNYTEVKVGARVSRSGNAVAASGDLAGEVAPVAVAAEGVTEVVIDRRIP